MHTLLALNIALPNKRHTTNTLKHADSSSLVAPTQSHLLQHPPSKPTFLLLTHVLAPVARIVLVRPIATKGLKHLPQQRQLGSVPVTAAIRCV